MGKTTKTNKKIKPKLSFEYYIAKIISRQLNLSDEYLINRCEIFMDVDDETEINLKLKKKL